MRRSLSSLSLALSLSASVLFSCSSTTPTDASPDGGAPADASAASAAALTMNDVSVLLPIPASPSAAGTLGPDDSGKKGPLLLQATYDKIPKFGVKPAQGLDFARMRVVAVRFDGCFPRPEGCEAQIRLVMQPITDDGQTLDSALHLFYHLEPSELATVVSELRRLHTLAPELPAGKTGPLDVHPALVAQGLDGAYGKALRELVLRFAGDDSFVRMTFFLRAPPKEEEWFFGGFDRVDGALRQLDIVGVGKSNQRVNRPIRPDGYTYTFTPSPKLPENIDVLLSTEAAKSATPEAREAAVAALARIENPAKYGPDQLSCAGCHVSTFVGESVKNAHGLDTTKMPDAFRTTHDVSRTTEAALEPSSLRAFGYFADRKMIGNRVIFESAAVVDDLEKRFPVAK